MRLISKNMGLVSVKEVISFTLNLDQYCHVLIINSKLKLKKLTHTGIKER